MDILNLDDLEVVDVTDTLHTYEILAVTASSPEVCPKCGVIAPSLYRHGKYEQEYADLPIHGKRTAICVVRQRYTRRVCRECSSTFMEPLPQMHVEYRMTKRLVAYIERKALTRTFTGIARDIGVSEATIRNVFSAYAGRLDEQNEIIAPCQLGIDEIHLLGKPRCVLTDIEHSGLVDILRNRRKRTVAEYLRTLPCRERIEVVAMDMWNPYRTAVQDTLPQTMIVIDKFHVLRMANQAVDAVRKAIRAALTKKQIRQLMRDRHVLLRRYNDLNERGQLLLDTWLVNFPRLEAAYYLKEDLFELWTQANNSHCAAMRVARWRSEIPDDIQFAFDPLLTALDNWHAEIFAYFDYPITNAYTEAVNGLAKLKNRIGRGYSFEVIRVKMLYDKDHDGQSSGFMSADISILDLLKEAIFGPHKNTWRRKISTLVRRIESGSDPVLSTLFFD